VGDSVGESRGGTARRASREAARESSWERYVERSAGGDQSAMAALYDESSRLVHSVAMRVLGDQADADEVTLDVYTQVWKTAATYEASRGSVTAWLVMLARSRALDRARSRGSRSKHETPLPESYEFHDYAATPEKATEFNLRRTRIASALNSLPHEQRELVQLAFFDGMSHSELAEKLGQPLGTVKTRIRSGILKLREQLEAYAP
jgi:RNA polymerase sigma-70 factor, ECF subfamily